jgi:hypothetical protein
MSRGSKLFATAVVLYGSSLALGCAAMIRGSHQRVPVSTSPPGALVRVGPTLCVTPCTLRLERSRDQVLAVRKDGYKDATARIESSLNPAWMLLDTLIFFPFNFAFTDADYDLTPETVALTLEPPAE